MAGSAARLRTSYCSSGFSPWLTDTGATGTSGRRWSCTGNSRRTTRGPLRRTQPRRCCWSWLQAMSARGPVTWLAACTNGSCDPDVPRRCVVVRDARNARNAMRSDQTISLCETLDRVLNTGVVVTGEVVISVADVDLIYLGLQLTLTSVETARRAMLTLVPR